MKKYFLLPHCYAKTGLCLMVLFLIMFGIDLAGPAPKIKVPMPYIVNEIIGENAWFGILPSEDMYMEIWMLGIFISLLFIAMSKEKTEDEMIMQIRLKSVFFSLWFTSVLFVVETLFFFNIAYAYSLWATLYVLLIVFIIKFRYEIHQLK